MNTSLFGKNIKGCTATGTSEEEEWDFILM